MLFALPLLATLSTLPVPPALDATLAQAKVQVLRGTKSKALKHDLAPKNAAPPNAADAPATTAPGEAKGAESAKDRAEADRAKEEASAAEKEKAAKQAKAKEAQLKEIEDHGHKVREGFGGLNDALSGGE